MIKQKEQIESIVEKYQSKVDYLEVRIENKAHLNIRYSGEDLDNVSSATLSGGYVRSCYKGAWGFCSFNDLTKLESYVEDSIKQSRLLGSASNERTILSDVKPVRKTLPIKLAGKDPRNITLDDKVNLLKHYHSLMRSQSNKIANARARYDETTQHILLINSEGTCLEHGWVDLGALFSATSKKDGMVQVGQESLGSRKGYEDLENLDEKIIKACKRSVDSLELKAPNAGKYTVVIDPVMTGLFVHEAFGHLSEGDFIFDNPQMQELMVFGKTFGKSFLNIYDGAKIEDHKGSYAYDDEGVPAQSTQLIKDGVLVGRLHSRETAGKLKETPTGNARCLDYRFPPIVRMTNTWIEPQDNTVEDLIAGVKEGIWAGNWLGGQTNGEMFTFASGEARMIRNGKLEEPLKSVNLTGNVFQTLKDIDGIANDMSWDESGGCGKSGQSGLPVGVGGPSIRIQNVTVPGE